MRTFFTALLLSFCLPLFAQTTAKVPLLLSQIGKTLDNHRVPATAHDEETGFWEWRFLMAEAGLKGELKPSLARQLTSFTFTYDPTNHNYRGEIQQAKDGADRLETLTMIFFQLQQNIIQFGNMPDVVKLNGKRYYLLYFPQRETK
jgi:hypothetical protein